MTYSITLAGTPPRKNRRHALVRGRLINSKDYKLFVEALGAAWTAAGHPAIASGTWALAVHSTWPRLRHLDVDVPLGDCDAPISWIMDAMQAAGILDDDARIMSLAASKAQSPNPSTIVTLTQL